MFVKQELETKRVRGLCFHNTNQWLLVSFHNGEIVIYDYEIQAQIQKYKETDKPVRSVDFHNSSPLFCSGSDDNFVRVFDYEKQCCICCFTEHFDIIRTVQFHHTLPLIVSSSNDQTVRIWNYQTKSNVSIIAGHTSSVMSALFHPTEPYIITASLDDQIMIWDISSLASNPSTFLTPTLKISKTSQTLGINYAQWHPNRQLVISCSKDQTIKIWSFDENDINSITTLQGSCRCSLFHPFLDIIVSCSKEGNIQLWETKNYLPLIKYRNTNNRFSSLSCHCNQPLFAVGHENGFLIIRSVNQRTSFVKSDRYIIYYKNNSIRRYNFITQSDQTIGVANPKPIIADRHSALDIKPIRLQYNENRNLLLVEYKNMFELHELGKIGQSELYKENGKSPIWISRNQFAFLSENNNILNVKEFNGSSITKIQIPLSNILFPVSNNLIYLSSNDYIYLFDMLKRKIINKLSIFDVKFSNVSENKKFVAFISNSSIIISTINLDKVIKHAEGTKIKGGVWFRDDFFVFATKKHIKYILPNGEFGVLRSLTEKVYIAAVTDTEAICFIASSSLSRIEIDMNECMFKAALSKGDISKAKSILKNLKVRSERLIQFISKMGHPEIALQLIDNPSDKFRFALDAGDLDEAFRIAETLNDPNAWEALADKSMLCGNFAQAEQAIKRSGNAERLAFFYLISGCGKKLKSMDCNNFLSLQRSIWMNDRESIFHLTKDILPLVAFIAADKEELRLQITKLSNTNIPNKFGCKADLTNPIADEGSCEDWPHLNIPIHKINDEDKGDNKWEEEAEIDESNVWGEDDLEIDEKEIENTFVPPLIGESEQQKFALRSHVPADAVAAGLFGEALNELHEQIALINAEPLKRIFIQSYISSNAALPSCACSPLLVVPLLAHETFPNTNHIKETVKTGKVLFRTGKFQESIESFRTAIQSIPLLVCSSNSELDEIYSLIEKCKNYIIGLTLEIARKQETNPARQLELASYFTHCKLDSSHLRLTLQSAMGLAFREKYYGQARTFASRLLELSPSQRTAEQARKVIQASKVAEKEQPQKPPKIEYEYRKPFVVCSKSLKPIYGGEERISCPFCGAFFKTEYKGLVCNICDLSQIGAKTNGLELIRKSN